MSDPAISFEHLQECWISLFQDGPTMASSKSAKMHFDLMAPDGTNLIIVIGNTTGALSDSVTEEISKRTKDTPVVVISSKGYEHLGGVSSISYGTQRKAYNSGVVFLKDVNVSGVIEVVEFATNSINSGTLGEDLKQALIDRYGAAMPPVVATEEAVAEQSSRNDVIFPQGYPTLASIFSVGPFKYIGVVSSGDIKESGLSLESVQQICESGGLTTLYVAEQILEHEPPGTLAVYDRNALQGFLNEHFDILQDRGWATDAGEFAKLLCTEIIHDPTLYQFASYASRDVRHEAEVIPPLNAQNIPSSALKRPVDEIPMGDSLGLND